MGRSRSNGEGSVEKLPSGKWRAVRCSIDFAGKRKRISKSFERKKDAVEWLANNHGSEVGEPITLSDWADTWLRIQKGRVKASTFDTDWRMCKRIIEAIGRLKLRDLNQVLIEHYLQSLELTINEKHKVGVTLRKMLNSAVTMHVLPKSPMKGVVLKKPKRAEQKILTHEEIRKLISAADQTKFKAAFRLWIETGMRPAEFIALKWKDFDANRQAIHIRRSMCKMSKRLQDTKTKRSNRTLTISQATASELIKVQGQPEQPIVMNIYKQHFTVRNFHRRVWAKLCRLAGITATPYMVRHTMATTLLRNGVNMKIVSERLGHEDVSTTLSNYAHCMPEDQGIAANKMADLFPTDSPHDNQSDNTPGGI